MQGRVNDEVRGRTTGGTETARNGEEEEGKIRKKPTKADKGSATDSRGGDEGKAVVVVEVVESREWLS